MAAKNIEEFRDYILDCIERVERKKLNIEDLSTIAKSGEVVFSSVKLQLAYNNMRGEKPNIEFLQTCNKGLPEGKFIGKVK